MKRMYVLMMLVVMITLVGCSTQYSESDKVVTATWEDDGRVLYVREYTKWKTVNNTLGTESVVIADTFYLNRCDVNGDNKEELFPIRGKVLSLNNSGEWIVVSTISDTGGMYVMKLDGSGFQMLGRGLYPDLSPDGSKIVYAKKGEGIWIMNRDGSGDHQITTDGSYPSWSPDDTLIAYGALNTHIIKLNGEIVKYYERYGFHDWGPKGSNEILVQAFLDSGMPIILNVITLTQDTLEFGVDKWSPTGDYFIGDDAGGYYIINRDGTNKHYIEP